MFRSEIDRLIHWKNSKTRKQLIIRLISITGQPTNQLQNLILEVFSQLISQAWHFAQRKTL